MIELDKIYNMDCVQGLKLIDDNSIDCIVTSPPYNKKFFCKQKVTNQVWSKFNIDYDDYGDNMELEKYEQWLLEVLNECFRILKPNGSMFFNHKPIRYNNKIYHPLQILFKCKFNIYQEIVWNRKNSPNIRKEILLPNTERIWWLTKGKPKVFKNNIDKVFNSEVWTFSALTCKEHPAPFPQTLPQNCILLTTEVGDTVLDPFSGIGTTVCVSKKLNRKYIGFDLSKNYCEITEQKLSEIT
jgi:modification methylase